MGTEKPAPGPDRAEGRSPERRPPPRGPWRAIPEALLEDPKLEGCGSDARLLLLVLRVRCRYGLASLRPLDARLREDTRLTPKRLSTAKTELQRSGLVEFEGSMVWVHGALGDDPVANPRDVKHRRAVAAYLAGLPQLSIVERFRVAHRSPWLTDMGALAGVTEGPSQGLASTRPIPRPKPDQDEAEAPRPPASGPSEAELETEERNGARTPGRGPVEPAPARLSLLEEARKIGIPPPANLAEVAPARETEYRRKREEFRQAVRQAAGKGSSENRPEGT